MSLRALRRHGEMVKPLKGIAEQMLQLEPYALDGPLLVAMVDAYGQAAEHRFLLEVLKPKEEAPKDGQEREAPFRGFRWAFRQGVWVQAGA